LESRQGGFDNPSFPSSWIFRHIQTCIIYMVQRNRSTPPEAESDYTGSAMDRPKLEVADVLRYGEAYRGTT
jgi:hypothetical protein